MLICLGFRVHGLGSFSVSRELHTSILEEFVCEIPYAKRFS